MLASPVSPSVSLGSSSHSHTSMSGHSGSPNGIYASPRHPAYLPPLSSATITTANQQSPSSSHHSSSTGLSQPTSNYSKYTTHSQIGRINDVLAEKVLHSPLPSQVVDDHEKGIALKRLIAFLDGEDDDVQSNKQEVEQRYKQDGDTQERHVYPAAGPSNFGQTHQPQEVSDSIYTSQDHSRLPSHRPSTPPSTRLAYSALPNETHKERDLSTYTPRPSSSQGHLHPSHGHARHQAPVQHHHNPAPLIQQRAYCDTTKYKSVPRKSRDEPSQSVLLSTQTQLERLKSEVSHLDELVNRLKSQYISPDQAGLLPSHHQTQSSAMHENPDKQREQQQHYDENHHGGRDVEQNEIERKQTEQIEYKRRILEYESAPASQNDILRLVQHLDSLIWMRNPSSSNNNNESEDANNQAGNNVRLGRGTRSDETIFTKGNLDHLARRMTAWENVVRRKEEESRSNYAP